MAIKNPRDYDIVGVLGNRVGTLAKITLKYFIDTSGVKYERDYINPGGYSIVKKGGSTQGKGWQEPHKSIVTKKQARPFIIIQGFGVPDTKMNLTEMKQYAKKKLSYLKREGIAREWDGWTSKDLDNTFNALNFLEVIGMVKSHNMDKFTYSTHKKTWTLNGRR